MRKFILTLLIMTTTATSAVWAQEKSKYKEDVFQVVGEPINVSADRLWEIIGPGFENAGIWSTAVDHSSGEGKGQFNGATCDERHCEINAKGFNKLTEKITLYDDQKKELAYDVTEGIPGFVKKSNSHWRVIDLGNNQSQLEITLTMHTTKFMGSLMGGMLKGNIKKVLPTIHQDLKVYAETGNISKEKQERMNKLGKKNPELSKL